MMSTISPAMPSSSRLVVHDCFSYKAAAVALVVVLILFLPFVFMALYDCCHKKKRRPKQRGVVSIGRRRDQRMKPKVAEREVGEDKQSNFQTLHDYRNCPVVIPAIEITHDGEDNARAHAQDIAYAQIGKRGAGPTNHHRDVEDPKPSGDYADLLEESRTKQKMQKILDHATKAHPFAASTPACGDLENLGQGLQQCESIYISPVTDKRKPPIVDQRRDHIVHRLDSEGSDVFTPNMDYPGRKFSLTTALRVFPNRISSRLASITNNAPSAGRYFPPKVSTNPPTTDALYLTFKETSSGESSSYH